MNYIEALRMVQVRMAGVNGDDPLPPVLAILFLREHGFRDGVAVDAEKLDTFLKKYENAGSPNEESK